MNGIRKVIVENIEAESEIMVQVPIGELRELAETVRCQALNLREELNALQGPAVDTLDARQVQYRLEELYKQLTGIKDLSVLCPKVVRDVSV